MAMRWIVVAASFALAGCGEVAKVDARTEYQKSVADYHACLDANPKDVHACDDKRLAMEVEERAANNLSGAQDGNTTATINVQSR